MARVWRVLVVLVVVVGSVGAAGDAPIASPADLYLVPNAIAGELDGALLIHDYGSSSLVRLPTTPSPAIVSRLHAIADTRHVSFRSWQAEVADSAVDVDDSLPEDWYVLVLVGPVDRGWLEQLRQLELDVAAAAHPHALVVRGDGSRLVAALDVTTSAGFPVVQAIVPLPLEARMSRLLHGMDPEVEHPLRVQTFAGLELDESVKRLIGGDAASRSQITIHATPSAVPGLLLGHPEIGYVEPLLPREPHANLAARAELLDVAAVWDELAFTGDGVVIAHNDTGVDLSHPDLAPAVVAAVGTMAYTDTAHGSHTAGALVGRGGPPSPTNTAGCGDQIEPLPTVRGMAWSAGLATNNLFDGGLSEVADMMAWGVRQGALVSSNSWGVQGDPDEAVLYSSDAATVDAAVRDADLATPESEPLTVFFSAGNLGPQPGTVTSPGTAKNAITVGATQNDRCGSWVPGNQPGPDPTAVFIHSSRGPSQGRIKPDLVAPGSDVLAAESADPDAVNAWDQQWTGDRYALATGSSMACALAAGAGAVFHEFYWRSFARVPSPALVKAAMINGAEPPPEGAPSFDHGWGRLDLRRSIEGPAAGDITFIDEHDTQALETGERWSTELDVFSTAEPLRVTLVWSDVPGEADADHPLVNDLDLVVTAPDGTAYRGNLLEDGWSIPNPGPAGDGDNPVENVFVASPAPGTWQLEVVAVAVAAAPPGLSGQDFAAVYSGDAAPCPQPSPPAEVSAAAIGDNLVVVSWQPVPDAVEYEIYRARTAGGRPYFSIATVAGGETHYDDGDVDGGITYHYVVRARTDCWSELSAEASATAAGACGLPPLFDGIGAVEDAETVTCSLRLSWSAAAAECGGGVEYDIYRSIDPTFEPGPSTVIAAGVAATSHTDAGLVDGGLYHYVVRARDAGNGAAEDNRSVLSGSPSGPDLVYLAEGGDGGGTGWVVGPGSAVDSGTQPWTITAGEAFSPPSSWFVPDADGAKDQVLQTAEPLALPPDRPLRLEFRHLFDLQRKRDGGRLEYSTDGGQSWHDILASDGFEVPADPQRIVEGGYNESILSGAAPNPLAGGPAWTDRSRGWRRVEVDLEDLAGSAVLLRWRIGCDAEDAVGGGWWVDDIRVYAATPCQRCAAPVPPANLTATPSGDNRITLSWTPVAAATEYLLARATRAGGPHEPLASATPPTVQYNDDGVSGGTTYHYTVAVRTDCRSAPSDEASAAATGPCTLPPEFWGLISAADARATECAVDLSWGPAVPRCPDSTVSFRVYRSLTRDIAPEDLIAGGVPVSPFRDDGVGYGADYHYLVRAIDDGNLSEDSNPKVLPAVPRGPDAEVFWDDIEGDTDAWRAEIGSAADSGSEPWSVTTTDAYSPVHAWFCSDEGRVKDQVVRLAEPLQVPDADIVWLQFRHRFDLEPFWDGGVLEYSTDGGATWHDILAGDGADIPPNDQRFQVGGYVVQLSIGTGNPLATRRAWTGPLLGWGPVRVDLVDFVGHSVLLRWRLGCDRSRASVGWWLDDVAVVYTTRCATRNPTEPRRGGKRVP